MIAVPSYYKYLMCNSRATDSSGTDSDQMHPFGLVFRKDGPCEGEFTLNSAHSLYFH